MGLLSLWDRDRLFDKWFNRNKWLRVGWSICPDKEGLYGKRGKCNLLSFRIAIGNDRWKRHGRRNNRIHWPQYHIDLYKKGRPGRRKRVR